MKKPQRMGDNPLDMLMTEPEKASERSRTTPASARKATASAKAHATFHLSVEIVDEARDAVSALAGPPLHLTLAELVDRALRAELGRLRKQHNGGEPFPKRRAPIRSGRPIG